MGQSGINRVTLIGHLTRDCEMRYTDGGLAICTFSIASNYNRKQGEQWVDEVNYFDLVFFGKRGESVSRYLTKGKQVGIDGELRQDRWEQDGKTRSKVKIIVNNLQFLGSKNNTDGSSAAYGSSAPPPPAPPAQQQGAAQPASSGAPPAAADSFEDDIPF